MDKKTILANVDSLSAEQLFDEIKSGKVTIDDIISTGNLDPLKRNKINLLKRDLESLDDADWERARYGNEAVLSDYISKYPAGNHVSEAKQKIDNLEKQRATLSAQKQKILNDIKNNPNTHPPSRIIEYLKSNNISREDLLNCGIPDSAIDNLHNITRVNLLLGDSPKTIPQGFTEVYFWGATGSGKTCALGAILQMAHKKGYLNIATGTGYRYAHQLMNIFSDDGIANDYLPPPTPLESTQYLPFTLNRAGESSKRSVSLIELSGEIFRNHMKNDGLLWSWPNLIKKKPKLIFLNKFFLI